MSGMARALGASLHLARNFVYERFIASMAGIIHATVALTSGTRLGPYEILIFLGAGGMGEVYRAHDSHLHRDVALKVLANLSSDPDPARTVRHHASCGPHRPVQRATTGR